MEARTFNFILPERWAPFLLQGDAFSVDKQDRSACQEFLAREGLDRRDCIGTEDARDFGMAIFVFSL